LGFGAFLALRRYMSRDHTKLRSFQLADSLVITISQETKNCPPEQFLQHRMRICI
jgi:hypothetical protein